MELNNKLQTAFTNIKPFYIEIDGFDCFKAPKNVVFIKIKKNKPIMTFHSMINSIFENDFLKYLNKINLPKIISLRRFAILYQDNNGKIHIVRQYELGS